MYARINYFIYNDIMFKFILIYYILLKALTFFILCIGLGSYCISMLFWGLLDLLLRIEINFTTLQNNIKSL